MSVTNIAEELKARGLVEQAGGGEMKDFLGEKRSVYLGMDPTADSLHVGNLVPIMLMKHLANAGHEVLFLVGGGTGMIGDPRDSGERVLLDDAIITSNMKALHKQLQQILGDKQSEIVNNADWLSKLTVIEFLRDTAKHFTVNQLVKRDIIKRRLEAEDPLSFTEFSYSLLQGYDFLHLNKKKGVDMQVGGSDQWANIISGVDLIRRVEGKSAYALTTPIITDKKSGKKFGKSEGNAVWLDPEKTSPYEFYQFWLNVADEGVEDYFKIFTVLPLEEISSIMSEHQSDPQKRGGQKKLAYEVTKMIHGESEAENAQAVTAVMFGDMDVLANLDDDKRAQLLKSAPSAKVAEGTSIVDALVESKLAPSKSEAKRLIEGKAVSINGSGVESDRALEASDFTNSIALLKAGKKAALLSL